MLATPHTLSLITTYRCTAACDHCCFSCSPQNRQTIPTRRIHEYIEQSTEVPSIRAVVFTGGECFLLGKDLDELVRAAARQGFSTRFVSNAYWATSAPAARRRLERLERCGLKEANFSTGEQHARFVRPEYVRHGAIAAAELGLASVVAVDSFGESQFDFDAFVEDAEFRRHIDRGTVVLKVSPWMRFKGRRRLNYTAEALQQMDQHRAMGCPTVLKVIGITPNEELNVCCGLTVEEIPEMNIGSLKGKTIAEVLAAATDDFIKIWLHLHGPDAVLKYARTLDKRIRLPRQQGHTCEVCRFVYGNRRIRELVQRHPPPNMQGIVSQYVHSLVIPPTMMESSAAMQLLRAGGTVSKLKAAHRMTLLNPKPNETRGPNPGAPRCLLARQ